MSEGHHLGAIMIPLPTLPQPAPPRTDTEGPHCQAPLGTVRRRAAGGTDGDRQQETEWQGRVRFQACDDKQRKLDGWCIGY